MTDLGQNGRDRRAFSLLELLVVLVIIVITAGVIVAEMKGTFEDALLRSSARKIIDAVNVAHSQAVTVNRPHRLVLDAATGDFRIEQWGQGPDGGASGFHPIPNIPRTEGLIDSRIAIEIHRPDLEPEPDEDGPPVRPANARATTPVDSIGFRPDGTADGADILLRDRTGAALVLQVNPVTSRVRITQRERDLP